MQLTDNWTRRVKQRFLAQGFFEVDIDAALTTTTPGISCGGRLTDASTPLAKARSLTPILRTHTTLFFQPGIAYAQGFNP